MAVWQSEHTVISKLAARRLDLLELESSVNRDPEVPQQVLACARVRILHSSTYSRRAVPRNRIRYILENIILLFINYKRIDFI